MDIKLTSHIFVTILCFTLLDFTLSYEESESKTLVLLDNFAIKETHSTFFQTIKDRGHSLTFKLADDPSLSLFKYGELIYQNLIVFSPNVEEFGGRIDVKTILDFIDEGGNILLVTGNKPSNMLRELGAECGVEVDVSGSTLIDHFNYDISEPFDRTLVVVDSDKLLNAPVIVNSKTIDPILYRGGGLLVNNTNPLVMPLLRAYDTSYCYNPSEPLEQAPNLIGPNIALIVAMQARNNARIVFSGSLYLFSNEAFTAPVTKIGSSGSSATKSGNRQLSEALSKWVLKETGVIRVRSVQHRRQEGIIEEPVSEYTIMDTAVYRMEIEEKRGDKWVPYNADDIQLEFVRIDPFIRTYIPRIADGTYRVVFKIPDVYGVFKFKVDYKRLGYTNIFDSTQVSVRPLKHTQYERFITSAYPYYASAFSMMFGVFLFSIIVLHVSDEKSKTE